MPIWNADGGTAISFGHRYQNWDSKSFCEVLVSYNDCLEEINSKSSVDTLVSDHMEGCSGDATVKIELSTGRKSTAEFSVWLCESRADY